MQDSERCNKLTNLLSKNQNFSTATGSNPEPASSNKDEESFHLCEVVCKTNRGKPVNTYCKN
jgi:hypothetical protein